MNAKQAIEKGYSFTGHYSHNKEEQKENAAKERALGNKACVVDVPPSKYSRGHGGMGYSVYIIESAENKAKRETAAREQRRSNLLHERTQLLDQIYKLDAQLRELDN